MSDLIRVSVETVRGKVASGSALLVCAYENEEEFKEFHLDGAISLSEFNSQLSSIEKDREVFFYCA